MITCIFHFAIVKLHRLFLDSFKHISSSRLFLIGCKFQAFMSMFQILTQEGWIEVVTGTLYESRGNYVIFLLIRIYFVLYHQFVSVVSDIDTCCAPCCYGYMMNTLTMKTGLEVIRAWNKIMKTKQDSKMAFLFTIFVESQGFFFRSWSRDLGHYF